MEQNRTQLSEYDINVQITKLNNTGKYNEAVLKLVRSDLEYGLSVEEVEVYLLRKIPIEVQKKLSDAFRSGCDIELVTIMAEAGLNVPQIETAIGFHKDGAATELIKAVIEQNLNAHGMKEVYKTMASKMKAVQGVSPEEAEKIDKSYVDTLFEEMRKIVAQINYDEKRFDELNAKIKEISTGKVTDKDLEELHQKLADKDAIISNQQDNINQANSALARLRKEADSKDDEAKKMQEQIIELNTQLAKKDEEITALKSRANEPEEKSMDKVETREAATPEMIPLKDANGMVVYGIPVHYAYVSKSDGKEADYTVVERTERKNGGLVAMFGRLSFKKKSRQDIVKLVASGNLTPEQLVQIRIGMEKQLTENQLLNLINNNVPADQMKEIIEIAVLENSMQ